MLLLWWGYFKWARLSEKFRRTIYTCVTANTHRYGESSNAVELDAGATFVYWFQNVENVSVLLKAGSTKTGTKTLTYTSQGLFGLTVLEAA